MYAANAAKAILRDARSLLDRFTGILQLRRRNPGALIDHRVLFSGDPTRVLLGRGTCIFGPTVLAVEDGGGLRGARLEVGDRTYIGEFNNIRPAGAPIKIGRDCLVSQHITMVGSNHGVVAGRNIVDQPWTGDGIVLGDDVWVGAGVTVLPGARIGDGAVLAANSVIRGVVPDGAIVAGTPAREIGRRA